MLINDTEALRGLLSLARTLTRILARKIIRTRSTVIWCQDARIICTFFILIAISQHSFGERRSLESEVTFYDIGAKTFLSESLKIEVLFEGLEIGEGPVWVPSSQRLIASDVKANKMYSWSEDEGVSVLLEESGDTGFAPNFKGGVLGSNGAAIDAAGDLIFCQHGDRRLARLSLEGPKVASIETVVAKFNEKRFNSPNDLTIAPNGDIYFSDPPYGFLDIANSNPVESKMVFTDQGRELKNCGIYRYRPSNGQLSLLSDRMSLPNGMALSPDGNYLYVNSSDMKVREIWRFSTKDGSGNVFYNGPFNDDEAGWFDGMKMHHSGHIFTTGPGGILVISPGGNRVAKIKLPDSATNFCFDEKQKYLYLTMFSYVSRIELKPSP